MKTWLADFHERSEYNAYPIVRRTRGGFGYKVGNDIISTFVGHPVHYNKGNGEWLPITLDYQNGHFEGVDFGWDELEKCVTYKNNLLYKPESITWNGVSRPLNFIFDAPNSRMVADVPNVGTYEIIYREGKVREVFTIPSPIDGILIFNVTEAETPANLHKSERRVMPEQARNQKGDRYEITSDMNYPVVIDPDYTDSTNDGYIGGVTATSYTLARSTSTTFDVTSATGIIIGQASGTWQVYRGYVVFDTSGILDTDTITQSNIKATTTQVSNNTTPFIIRCHKYNWTNPITAGNRETNYDGALASTYDADLMDTNGAVLNTQYTSSNLDVTWVSKTASTYYALLSAEDVNNSQPTTAEYIFIAPQEHVTTAYRPILTVVHSGASTGNFFAMF